SSFIGVRCYNRRKGEQPSNNGGQSIFIHQVEAGCASDHRVQDNVWSGMRGDRIRYRFDNFPSREHSDLYGADFKVIEDLFQLARHGVARLVVRSKNTPGVLESEAGYSCDPVAAEPAHGLNVGQDSRSARRIESGYRQHRLHYPLSIALGLRALSSRREEPLGAK